MPCCATIVGRQFVVCAGRDTTDIRTTSATMLALFAIKTSRLNGSLSRETAGFEWHYRPTMRLAAGLLVGAAALAGLVGVAGAPALDWRTQASGVTARLRGIGVSDRVDRVGGDADGRISRWSAR